jgi:phosphopantetheinyl transferase
MDDVAQFKALFERVGVDIEKEFLRTKPRETAEDLDSEENSMLDPDMSPDPGSEMSAENSMP